jgi:hypothetical protein
LKAATETETPDQALNMGYCEVISVVTANEADFSTLRKSRPFTYEVRRVERA